ncbi:MAG TPA: hypothetical protein PLO23_05270 [Alphaproteobacteria bacterium]|nr:hypothetical protein [Alphaproteobacteria bacterium]
MMNLFFKPKPEASEQHLLTLDGRYNVYNQPLLFRDGGEDRYSDNRFRYVFLQWAQTHAAPDAPFRLFLSVGLYFYEMPEMTRAQLEVFKARITEETAKTTVFIKGFEAVSNEILQEMGFANAKAVMVKTPSGAVTAPAQTLELNA